MTATAQSRKRRGAPEDWRKRPRNTPIRKTLAERLWSRYVITESGCWEWQGHCSQSGYGSIGRGRRAEGTVGTHRAAWEVTHGPIPVGMAVCHRCDNPPCINPGHLFLGTLEDNNADMREKGRAVNPVSPQRFSDEQVQEMVRRYRAGESAAAIAEEFGTSRQYVNMLSRGVRRADA